MSPVPNNPIDASASFAPRGAVVSLPFCLSEVPSRFLLQSVLRRVYPNVSNPLFCHQSLELCLVINLLKVSPPPICHACARRWQPLRKQIVRLRPRKGTIRRSSDLWRSRRLICQTRTCRWPNGRRLASQGNYAFCAYLRVQWMHYHRVPSYIYLFSVSGPFCCGLLCQT